MLTQLHPRVHRSLARTRAIGLALMTVTALGATACGGNSSSASGGSCTAPGVTDKEVKVAVITPLTGPSAPTFKGFLEGAEAALKEVNDAGGVNGRKFVVVNDDDKGDGAQQVIAARNAIQSQKAFGIIAASRIDTMYDFVKSQKVPVTGYPGQPAYSKDLNTFGYGGAAGTGFQSTSVIKRLAAAGATKVAVLSHNSPGNINTAKGFEAAAAESGTMSVVMKQYDIPLGSFDATSIALKIKESGADTLYSQILTDSSVSVLKALKAQGVQLKATSFAGMYDPNVYPQIADLLEGSITATLGQVPTELKTDATKKYEAAIAKYAPGIEPNEGFTPAGYLSGKLFAKGVEAAGDCLSRESFATKLRQVQGYDADGLLVNKAVFSPAELPTGTPYNKCGWYLTFKAGAWVPDPKPTCGDLIKF